MQRAAARALSILGHPLPVLMLTLLALAAHDRIATGTLLRMALGFAAVAAIVVAYSRWRVRRGDWRHVDASGIGERRHLNRFLLVVLLASALLAAAGSQPRLATPLALSALLVVLAMATARWWKLSLHLAFAMFAAMSLLRISWWAFAAMVAFAALLAWSRLQLARHAPRDLVAGACGGAIAGLLAWSSVPPHWQG